MPTTDCSNKEDTDKTYVEQVTETCFFFSSPCLRRMAGDRRQTSVCPAVMFNRSAFNAERSASKMYSSIIAFIRSNSRLHCTWKPQSRTRYQVMEYKAVETNTVITTSHQGRTACCAAPGRPLLSSGGTCPVLGPVWGSPGLETWMSCSNSCEGPQGIRVSDTGGDAERAGTGLAWSREGSGWS